MLNVNRLRLHNFLKLVSRSLVPQAASTSAVLVGSLVLIGWYWNIEILKKGLMISPTTMKANTALCFIVCGVSLLLLILPKIQLFDQNQASNNQEKFHFFFLVTSRLGALVVQVIGLLTVCQYLFGWNLGIDELLFRDKVISASLNPGRMGLNTALNFALIGRAIELLNKPGNHRSYWYAQILPLIAGLVALQAIIGYVYKVTVFQDVVPYTGSMAIHTALTFAVLCVGILWIRPDQG